MKVLNLIKVLEQMDPELDVIIDGDDNGYYNVTGANTFIDEDGDKLANIVSSNEA